MLHHKCSIVGLMLWMQYALFRGKPWTSLGALYSEFLESHGTKAFSISEIRKLFGRCARMKVKTVLTHAAVLTSNVGQRHRGELLQVARNGRPRRFIKACCPRFGLFILIEAGK